MMVDFNAMELRCLDKTLRWCRTVIRNYDEGTIKEWFEACSPLAVPDFGICYNLHRAVYGSLELFELFLEDEGLDSKHPVGGIEEYEYNRYLWWDDEDSRPMHRRRVNLLREFVAWLEERQKAYDSLG